MTTRNPTPIPDRDLIDEAIQHAKIARDLLVRAGARHAADAQRRALKSLDGAARHAARMATEQERRTA